MPHLCRWHAGCFKCGFCQKLIGQGTVWTEPSHPGIPYCSNVCLAAVHNPCTVCGKPLTGMVGLLAVCRGSCNILTCNTRSAHVLWHTLLLWCPPNYGAEKQ